MEDGSPNVKRLFQSTAEVGRSSGVVNAITFLERPDNCKTVMHELAVLQVPLAAALADSLDVSTLAAARCPAPAHQRAQPLDNSLIPRSLSRP